MKSFARICCHISFAINMGVTLGILSPATQATERSDSFCVLVFSRTLGYRHDSIDDGIKALRELGEQHGFAVDATEDSQAIAGTNLARYQAVVFLSTTGDVLDSDQQNALKDYVLNGGGFAAVHGAVFGPLACEEKWDWYGQLFSCAFTNHSAVVPATVMIEDAGHPSTAGLPGRWLRTDEWYNFTGTPRGCARVLATVDESGYKDGTMGADHPIVWCRLAGKGRMWFTAMGHTSSSFNELLFRRHLLGGIQYAAGHQPANGLPVREIGTNRFWERDVGSVALRQGSQVIWKFNHGTNATKPFFHPVALPGGPMLTWDKPADHRWHHALWFSWKFLNGVNYWEENPKTGAADGHTAWQEPQIETHPDFSARIVMNLIYHPATNPHPVLTERREIEISAPDPNGTYYQDWTMTFAAGTKDLLLDRTPLPGEPGGQPWGGYAGLSVRFAQGIKAPQAVSNLEPVTFANGRYRGTATAMDYSGIFDGQEAGITILDAASNPNSPSPWYAINDATMKFFTPAMLCYQAYILKARQQLTLHYRVIVHPGRWDSGELRRAAEQFSSATSSKKP